MSDECLARIASESLSRVDCTACGGRLYTGHKPGCPVDAAAKENRATFASLMVDEYNRAAGLPVEEGDDRDA